MRQQQRIVHASVCCCWTCLVGSFLLLHCCHGYHVVMMAISFSTDHNLSANVHQYGHNKAHWFVPFSIDNKLRYCHVNHLSCFIGGGFSQKNNKFKRSSRFAKLYWIQYVLTKTRNKRQPTKMAYLDLDTVIASPTLQIFPSSLGNFSVLMVKCSPLSTGECVESHHASTVDSRYQTGVIFLTNDEHSQHLFVDRVTRHMETSHEVSSDQLFLNELLSSSTAKKDHDSLIDSSIHTISKTRYNAYPHMGRDSANNIQAIWTKSGLPAGDETASSRIVHFAGVYGAASIQNGHIHPPRAVTIHSGNITLTHYLTAT